MRNVLCHQQRCAVPATSLASAPSTGFYAIELQRELPMNTLNLLPRCWTPFYPGTWKTTTPGLLAMALCPHCLQSLDYICCPRPHRLQSRQQTALWWRHRWGCPCRVKVTVTGVIPVLGCHWIHRWRHLQKVKTTITHQLAEVRQGSCTDGYDSLYDTNDTTV